MNHTIRHITVTEATIARENGNALPPKDGHVIIPAKNAARGIVRTLAYLANHGFTPERIHVIVNGTTDGTDILAKASGLATVYKQEEILSSDGILGQLGQYGLTKDRLYGKGVAMFCGVLVLEGLGLAEEAPIFFLDADLDKLDETDPVGNLAIGWNAWGKDPGFHMAKLAMPNPDVPLMLASLAVLPKFKNIGAPQFLVCGQVVLRWGLLRRMRLSTGFSVEVAMLVESLETHPTKSVGALGEVAIPVKLTDDSWPERRYAIMMVQIISFLHRLHGLKASLPLLTVDDIVQFNMLDFVETFIQNEEGGTAPNKPTRIPLDGILPSIHELTAT